MPHAPTGPATLLASLPAHLGRTLVPPEVVIVGWSDDDTEHAVVAALNLIDPDPVSELYLIEQTLVDGAERIAVVVAFPPPPADRLPAPPTAEGIGRFVTACAARVGIEVLDVLVIHGDRWRSLACTDPTCCPPEGSPVPTPTGETP